MTNINIPPLFSHKVFEVFSGPKEVKMEDIQMLEEGGKSGPSIFIKEKMAAQRAEDKKLRQELRRRKKKGLAIDPKEIKKRGKIEVKNAALETLEIVKNIDLFLI